ncbi:acyltransferase family protein [Rhodococcus hoagii]|nr:acyltransferase family protein [Prescottella equi]
MNSEHLATPAPVGNPRAFVPALEGMRGFAAFGVLVTHVAFQTGATGDAVIGRIWGRFDLAVAVFFALSGFLLWRPHAGRGPRSRASADRRPVLAQPRRAHPAGLLGAGCAGAGVPARAAAAGRCGCRTWRCCRCFVPLTLTEGLTQMWSLSVEVAFYLVLPLLALALVKLRGDSARFRVPVLLAAAIVSLTWAFLPVPAPDGIHHDNWLPGYIPWFAAGMLLAELAMVGGTWVHRLAERRVWMAVIAGRGLRVVDDVAGRARGTGPRRAVAVRHEDRPRRGHEFRVAGAAGSRRAPPTGSWRARWRWPSDGGRTACSSGISRC